MRLLLAAMGLGCLVGVAWGGASESSSGAPATCVRRATYEVVSSFPTFYTRLDDEGGWATFTAPPAADSKPTNSGRYQVQGDRIRFFAAKPERCPGEDVTYTFECTANGMYLRLIADSCAPVADIKLDFKRLP